MKRAALERPRTVRELRRHIARDHDDVPCWCKSQAGRYRKRDAFARGRARCGVCHSHKNPRLLSRAERKAEITYREQLDE